MTFSVATLLIAASLISFWPGRNAAPGMPAAMAQQRADTARPAVIVESPRDEPSVQDKLNKRIDVDFIEAPLKDVAQILQEATGIQFVLRQKKLEEASVSIDTPVTRSLKGVRVSTLLDLLLADLELTYFEKDGLLLITTPEDAESNLETRVYDCRDLLAMAAPDIAKPSSAPATPAGAAATPPGGPQNADHPLLQGKPMTNFNPPGGGNTPGRFAGRNSRSQPPTESEKRTDQLIELIEGTVRPDSWDDVGGPGAIDAYNGLFVVSQTAKVHEDVEHVLDMLRKAAGLEAAKGARVVR